VQPPHDGPAALILQPALLVASVVEASVAETSMAEASVMKALVVKASMAEASVVKALVVEALVVEALVVEALVVEASVVEASVRRPSAGSASMVCTEQKGDRRRGWVRTDLRFCVLASSRLPLLVGTCAERALTVWPRRWQRPQAVLAPSAKEGR
jgi:hypothetical protein